MQYCAQIANPLPPVAIHSEDGQLVIGSGPQLGAFESPVTWARITFGACDGRETSRDEKG